MKLHVEYNPNALKLPADHTFVTPGARVSVTPNIDEDYWLMRVPLTEKQAVVCFPKFFTVGVGFQVEEDWNTNLPYSSPAEQIYEHIKHNKGDPKIRKASCIEAIRLLQAEIAKIKEDKAA